MWQGLGSCGTACTSPARAESQPYTVALCFALPLRQANIHPLEPCRARCPTYVQATQAYLAGNRAAAREMGAAGRWHNQQMHAAHAAAAQRQFAQRNPSGGGGGAAGAGSGTVGGVRTVDLHGLHVSEALTQVDALLAQHTKRGSGGAGARRLRVVVGVGSHGKVPSRLPAAVRRHLDACGVRYSEPYSGLLELMM